MSVSIPYHPNAVDQEIRQAIHHLDPGYWDFAAADTKEVTHGYHSYHRKVVFFRRIISNKL